MQSKTQLTEVQMLQQVSQLMSISSINCKIAIMLVIRHYKGNVLLFSNMLKKIPFLILYIPIPIPIKYKLVSIYLGFFVLCY